MGHPLKHISIRVPWHDSGWDGSVCSAPKLNGSCLKLKQIAEKRNDDAEESIAGKSINDMPEKDWPPCIAERAGFMAPFEYASSRNHPYNSGPESSHGHFRPTQLRHPPYSAATVPFKWMLAEEMESIGKIYEIDVREDREPDLGFKTPYTSGLHTSVPSGGW